VLETGATVLIVDDDDATRTLLRTYLTRTGHAVRDAASGAEALDLMGADVDIVLLDLMMPGLGGVETLRRMRLAGHRQPVILLTAVTSAEAILEALSVGAQDHLTKPISLLKVHARIEELLRPATAPAAADVVDSMEDLHVVMATSPPMPPPPPTAEEELPPGPTGVAPPASASMPPAVAPDEVRSGQLPRKPSTLLSRLASWTRSILPGEQPGLEVDAVLGGQYRLQQRLGEGTFGTVWRARPRPRPRRGGEGAAPGCATGAARSDRARLVSSGGGARRPHPQPPRRAGARFRPDPGGARLSRHGAVAW